MMFYRDKIDFKEYKNEFFPLTDNIENLGNKISTIKEYGGGDIPGEWAGGY